MATHSMRKTYAKGVFEAFSVSDGARALQLTKEALGHVQIGSTEKYLEVDSDQVEVGVLGYVSGLLGALG